MTSGIHGRCDCPLGRHHVPECRNYVNVWQTCPCPECTSLRIERNDPPRIVDVEVPIGPEGDDTELDVLRLDDIEATDPNLAHVVPPVIFAEPRPWDFRTSENPPRPGGTAQVWGQRIV